MERERIVDLVSVHLNVCKSEVLNESSLVDDLGADSLDEIELLMMLEEEINEEITDEEAEKIKTIQDVIDFCEKHDN